MECQVGLDFRLFLIFMFQLTDMQVILQIHDLFGCSLLSMTVLVSVSFDVVSRIFDAPIVLLHYC